MAKNPYSVVDVVEQGDAAELERTSETYKYAKNRRRTNQGWLMGENGSQTSDANPYQNFERAPNFDRETTGTVIS